MAKKKTHVSDFARNQLEKCGWTEGAGLGQSGQGITEAIKVNLKHDNRGVGHDMGKEFTHHWWNHVYDKAASKIQVKHTKNGEVDVSKIEDDSKLKADRSEKAASALYKNFVKSSTYLEDGREVKETKKSDSSDSDSSSSDESEKKTKLDDDELFRICGGRTAHKGARHGLKLSGKLARIAAQEASLSSRESSPLPDAPTDKNETEVMTKKKKKKKRNTENETDESVKKNSSDQRTSQLDELSVDNNNVISTKKKKKKKKDESRHDSNDNEMDKKTTTESTLNSNCDQVAMEGVENGEVKSKKKRKLETTSNEETSHESSKKKKKNKKRKD